MTTIIIKADTKQIDELASAVDRFGDALSTLQELAERVVELTHGGPNLVSVSSQLNRDPAVAADDLHARVEVNGPYTKLGAALGALGSDLEVAWSRHRKDLLSALSEIEAMDETEQLSR